MSKFILRAGAGVCCLPGLWVLYAAVVNFREMAYPAWCIVLVLEVIYIALAFTPIFMLIKGLKVKPWHWVLMGIVEVIVIALALYALWLSSVLL